MIRPRTIIVFLALVTAIFFLVKVVSVYWVIVFFNVLLIYINSVFLFAYFEFRKKKKPRITKWPSVTILIPNYNGGNTIEKCVQSAKDLEYKGRKEIIVLDDGSVDSSQRLLKKIKGIKVILNKKNKGKAVVLNQGIALAKGEIIVNIDSDTFPAKDALMKMIPHFGKNVGAVTGLVRAANVTNFVSKIQEIEYLVAFGFFQSVLSEINGVFVTPGPMSAFNAKILRDIGGYDEKNITEDMEIALRLQKHRYKIVAVPEAHIYTDVPTSLRVLFTQRVRWYRGKFFNTRKYKEILFNPRYGEFGMFSFPFSVIVEALAILLLIVTIAANIENVFNYFGFFTSFLSISNDFFGVLPTIGGIHSSVYFYFITVLMYSVLVYISHKFVDENISIFKMPQIILFLFVYGLFISSVYFTSFFKEVNASEYKW